MPKLVAKAQSRGIKGMRCTRATWHCAAQSQYILLVHEGQALHFCRTSTEHSGQEGKEDKVHCLKPAYSSRQGKELQTRVADYTGRNKRGGGGLGHRCIYRT